MQKLEVKCSVNFSRIMAHKNARVFSHYKVENKLFKASVFLNERQPNSPEHEDRSG